MDLLNPEYQKPLSAILSALLMLLPQTEAFNMLQRRLQLVSNLTILEYKLASLNLYFNYNSLNIQFKKVSSENYVNNSIAFYD